jgi:DNA-binding CsgD family transcriptional regulator
MLRTALIFAFAGLCLVAGIGLSRYTLSHYQAGKEWLLILGAGLVLAVGVWVGLRERRKPVPEPEASKPEPAATVLPSATPAANLTPREQEILHLLAQGLSNQQIADELCVSLNTVKTHTAKLYLKMEVPNRTSAIAKARNLGLLN